MSEVFKTSIEIWVCSAFEFTCLYNIQLKVFFQLIFFEKQKEKWLGKFVLQISCEKHILVLKSPMVHHQILKQHTTCALLIAAQAMALNCFSTQPHILQRLSKMQWCAQRLTLPHLKHRKMECSMAESICKSLHTMQVFRDG